uniref:Uncharacterized protein n=2 Tax=Graphocephala atropunctata TaxID=36148 RepID=A0A1B6LW25_9HEMI
MKKQLFVISAVLFLFKQTDATSKVLQSSCRDENNNVVSWFAIYKIPKIKDHSNEFIQSGVAYAYILSGSDQGWRLSEKSINDSNSIPGLTLAPLYINSSDGNSQDALYILYNDQPPVGNTSLERGHTKGVVFAEDSGGFWLVHSVPHYPPLPNTTHYTYPHSGLKNGQSYLCITLPPDQLELVGTQLMYNEPHIFANLTSPDLGALYPLLTKAALGSEVKSPPWYHTQILKTESGTNFSSFAKASKFQKDLYSDWVVTVLNVSVLAETWPNGPGRLNSSCQLPFRVENVDSIGLSIVGDPFTSHKDHSKWAVSKTKDEPWVCIGDINRAASQELRGGGTVCVRDASLWEAYFSSVSSVESCSQRTEEHFSPLS